jgi:hypothetical protein
MELGGLSEVGATGNSPGNQPRAPPPVSPVAGEIRSGQSQCGSYQSRLGDAVSFSFGNIFLYSLPVT